MGWRFWKSDAKAKSRAAAIPYRTIETPGVPGELPSVRNFGLTMPDPTPAAIDREGGFTSWFETTRCHCGFVVEAGLRVCFYFCPRCGCEDGLESVKIRHRWDAECRAGLNQVVPEEVKSGEDWSLVDELGLAALYQLNRRTETWSGCSHEGGRHE